MTACPSCHAHVRLDAEVERASCPFCNSPITAQARDVFARLRDIGTSTTGGIVTATLMGLGLVHCAEAPTVGTLAPLRPDGGEHAVSPLYGIPPIDSGIPDAQILIDAAVLCEAADPPSASDYGIPAIPCAADAGEP